jgi:hypothetical protein
MSLLGSIWGNINPPETGPVRQDATPLGTGGNPASCFHCHIKRAGVSKAAIHGAVKSGRLSATRQDDGSYQIDPAELHRVYEIAVTSETAAGCSDETIHNPHRNPLMAELEAELAGARQLIRLLET